MDAKRDLVPTEVNLRDRYATFAELEAACEGFCQLVNTRPHRVTGSPPVELLAQERQRVHPLPAEPVTVAFGQTRAVSWDGTVSFGGVRYSVPHQLVNVVEGVWVRDAGEEVIITVVDEGGPCQVARHRRGQRGWAVLCDEHYPQRAGLAGERTPHAQTAAEQAFLALRGATGWSRRPPRVQHQCGPRWLRRLPLPSCTAPTWSTRRWVLRRWPAGSPTATCWPS